MLINALRCLLDFLREATGEADYARYRERAEKQGHVPLTPREFHRARLERKFSGVCRCC